LAFRRLLRSADRFRESAILRGLLDLKTLDSKSRALLFFVTRADQRLFFFGRFFRELTTLIRFRSELRAYSLAPSW
jgi:hypothetical protein